MKNFLSIICFLLLAGCHSRTLTISDSGETLELNVGETFEVILPENAGTGYRWNMKTTPNSQMVISKISDNFETKKTKMLGAAQNRVFIYQAVNSGKVKLVGFHHRPWEKSTQNLPGVEYDILVK